MIPDSCFFFFHYGTSPPSYSVFLYNIAATDFAIQVNCWGFPGKIKNGFEVLINQTQQLTKEQKKKEKNRYNQDSRAVHGMDLKKNY